MQLCTARQIKAECPSSAELYNINRKFEKLGVGKTQVPMLLLPRGIYIPEFRLPGLDHQ